MMMMMMVVVVVVSYSVCWVSEGEVCDGLGVLQARVSSVSLHILPDQSLLLSSAAECDPGLTSYKEKHQK